MSSPQFVFHTIRMEYLLCELDLGWFLWVILRENKFQLEHATYYHFLQSVQTQKNWGCYSKVAEVLLTFPSRFIRTKERRIP